VFFAAAKAAMTTYMAIRLGYRSPLGYVLSATKESAAIFQQNRVSRIEFRQQFQVWGATWT
jgi:hypothetical protein